MSDAKELAYTLALPAHRRPRNGEAADPSRQEPEANGPLTRSTPRVARLMALAIRFEGLIRAGTMQDYAAVARAGRVTRARLSQIMKLLHLAPDLQEQILFLPEIRGMNERNLRIIVRQIDWSAQRELFRCLLAMRALQSRHTGMHQPLNQSGSVF
jgi:hypothetical protein